MCPFMFLFTVRLRAHGWWAQPGSRLTLGEETGKGKQKREEKAVVEIIHTLVLPITMYRSEN